MDFLCNEVQKGSNQMGLIARIHAATNEKVGIIIPATEKSERFLVKIAEESSDRLYLVAPYNSKSYNGILLETIRKNLDTLDAYRARLLFFGKKSESTYSSLKKTHHKLYDLLKTKRYAPQLRVYWSTRRPLSYFVVADNSVATERLTTNGSSIETFVKRNDTRVARMLVEKFDNELIKAGRFVSLIYPPPQWSHNRN